MIVFFGLTFGSVELVFILIYVTQQATITFHGKMISRLKTVLYMVIQLQVDVSVINK